MMAWREINMAQVPAALLHAGLGATPMQFGNKWFARQTGSGRYMHYGLGDTASDYNAASGSYTTGNNTLSGAQSAGDVQSAIASFLSSAQSSLAVMNDASNSVGAAQVQAYIDTIQTAQSSAANATDLATAQPNGATAQAAASSALALAQAVAGSNKGQPGGGGTQGQGGGGGGGGGTPTGSITCPTGTVNAGQVVTNISQCGGSAITTTTSGTNYTPWIIGAGLVVGAGALLYAAHKKGYLKKAFKRKH